jgi:hypothetical protein
MNGHLRGPGSLSVSVVLPLVAAVILRSPVRPAFVLLRPHARGHNLQLCGECTDAGSGI